MAQVKDVLPNPPQVPINTEPARGATLSDIWAKYDEETDSMLIYVTGQPVPGVNVYLKDNIYAIVDVHNENEMVGLYFEAWGECVPRLDIASRSWDQIKEVIGQGIDKSLALRLLALYTVIMIGAENAPTLKIA